MINDLPLTHKGEDPRETLFSAAWMNRLARSAGARALGPGVVGFAGVDFEAVAAVQTSSMPLYVALLTGDMDAPTYVLGVPTTVNAHPLKWDDATARPVEDVDNTVELRNMDPELEGHDGYMVWWTDGLTGFEGHNIVVAVGCSDVRTAP